MPVDKKRKANEKSKAAAPTKKRKVEPPKGKATTARGKAATSKVKKPETKKTPAKVTKTPAKAATKATPAKKTPAKATKTPAKPTKVVKKPAPAKKEPPKKSAVRKPPPKAAATVTRAKLDKAKVLKAKAVTAKAKLKATKTLPKGKVIEKKKAAVKKQESEEESEEEEETKTPATKAKAVPTKAVKRKAEETEGTETPAKKRTIIENKRLSGFAVEGRSKRTITPNKKYADFETENMPKAGKVSELRAFIQEKKSGKSEKEASPKVEKKKVVTKSPVKKTPAKEKSPKDDEEEDDDDEEKIKIFKPSEMKPAEKLLKKLQKKLEKEAKGTPTPVTTPENREKAKIKITKVVDYKKPLSSDDVEMKKLAKKIEANKPKPSPAAAKAKLLTPKTQKPTETKVVKPKATPNQVKTAKATPKQQTVEKIVKPKKIKDLKREERPIQAKFLCQKSIQLADDNQNVQCWITGIGVFPSGEIIMVDMSNRRIKLFSKDFEFLSKVKLDAIPQDISVSPVNACFAYFTKPFSKEGIQKVMMSDGKLTLKEYFVTNGTNRGITCTKAGILTSVQDGRYHDVDINHFKIYLLDYNGNVLQSVSTDQTGNRLFKLPLYFTVSSNGKQMIVADCIKLNSYILNVDMDGKIKFKYEGMNNNPITPRGLAIDDDDNIYVTEWERNSIYILSPAGKRLQMLFSHSELQQDKVDGLLKPYQLCYYKTENQKRLIVSQESCNKIKVFKLLSKEEMEAETAAEAEKKKVEEEAKAKANADAAPAKPATEVNAQASTSTATTEVTQVTEPQKPEEAPKPEAIVVPPPTPEVITLAATGSETKKVLVTAASKGKEPKKVLVTTASTGTEPKKVLVTTSTGTETKKVTVTSPSALGQETKRIIVNTPEAKKIIIAPPSDVGSDAKKAILNPVTATAVEGKKILVSPSAGAKVMKLVTVSPPPAKTTTQVVAQSVVAPKPTTIVVTKPAQPKPVPVSDKKTDLFADTANDFDDDGDAETEVNGKLQDIVNAFPNESETEPLQTSVATQIVTIPDIQAHVTSVPAPAIEEPSAPILTLEPPTEVMPTHPAVMENIVADASVTPQTNETVISDIVDQSVEAAGDVSNTIIETVVVSDNAFADLNTITYSSVPQGEMVVVSEQAVIDSTITSDPNTDPNSVTQVTNETVYVPEYQNVVTDVPVELETITTEYVV